MPNDSVPAAAAAEICWDHVLKPFCFAHVLCKVARGTPSLKTVSTYLNLVHKAYRLRLGTCYSSPSQFSTVWTVARSTQKIRLWRSWGKMRLHYANWDVLHGLPPSAFFVWKAIAAVCTSIHSVALWNSLNLYRRTCLNIQARCSWWNLPIRGTKLDVKVTLRKLRSCSCPMLFPGSSNGSRKGRTDNPCYSDNWPLQRVVAVVA